MEVIEDILIDNLKIIQDDTLYRFTSDAVILSKFASFKKGEVVADFCSGSGIVGIHYYALNKGLKSVDLIEVQQELALLSKKSVELNGLQEKFTVLNMPIQNLGSEYNQKYSLILCNPPYKKCGSGETNLDKKIAICRHEVLVTQEEIISIASKKLKYGGRLCMCQRVERLTEMIVSMKSFGLEPSRLQFIVTNNNQKPYLFLIEAVKGVKPQLKVLENYVNGAR
ncbi:MAG: methyltransferase [Clostridia bacterium]|nr:methyltransferase [Clostridia bacterium]